MLQHIARVTITCHSFLDRGHVRGDMLKHNLLDWENGEPIDLNKEIGNASGWESLEHGLDINDSGYIAGVGVNAVFGGGNGAFLLIPKEP